MNYCSCVFHTIPLSPATHRPPPPQYHHPPAAWLGAKKILRAARADSESGQFCGFGCPQPGNHSGVWLNKFLICFILELFPADDTHLRAPLFHVEGESQQQALQRQNQVMVAHSGLYQSVAPWFTAVDYRCTSPWPLCLPQWIAPSDTRYPYS